MKARILYIGPVPPEVGGQAFGGVATFCWELATQARKNGYEVYILTNTSSSFTKNGIQLISLSLGNRFRNMLDALNLYIRSFKEVQHLNFKEKLNVFYTASLIKEPLKHIRPDLIHVMHILDPVNLSLGVLNDCPPVIVSEHGTALLYEYDLYDNYGFATKEDFLRRVKASLRKANYIISQSEFSKYSFLKEFSLPKSLRVKSILCPINADKMPLLDKEEEKIKLGLGNKKVILFCGAHLPVKRKGLDILLKAVASNSYLRENCMIVIITSKEAKFFAQNFIRRQNIDGLVLDHQPWEILIEYYNAADVFVMPSRQEAIGLAYYEALLAGTPIVGFFKSVEELERVLGIYIGEKFNANEDDERRLAEKIVKVLNTKFDRQLLRKKVVEKLSWEVKFYEFDAIYKQVLSRTYENVYAR